MKYDIINPVLVRALEAHGGWERWRERIGLSSSIRLGGDLWALKGTPMAAAPLRTATDFHRQWTSMAPFGQPDWTMTWTPDRVVIENESWEPVVTREKPRSAFIGHGFDTPWDPLHLAYFSGYAMWTYHALPFILAEPGYEVREIDPIVEGGKLLRGLKARFPEGIHSHSREQLFYFDAKGLLRRHDYAVDVFGGTGAAHFLSDYVEVEGFRFATKRRVHPREKDGFIRREVELVSIDLSDFVLS